MNYDLFKTVTKNDKGRLINELPEQKQQMKDLRIEFNKLVNSLQFINLGHEKTNENYQNSGYFKKYFWNKIYFTDAQYKNKEFCLWLGMNAEGLHIYFGTSEKFDRSLKDTIMNFAKMKINNDGFDNFKLNKYNDLIRYTYTENMNDTINKQDFINLVCYLEHIYKEALEKFILKSTTNENTNVQKNIILYGAPGVGKTHNYQNIISMIENGENQKDIFYKITDNTNKNKLELNNETFQDIKNDGRVEFITFHQSYSYEDFIEGFRPEKNGNIDLKDGIFKIISDEASQNLKNSNKTISSIKEDNKTRMQFENYVSNRITNNEVLKLQQGEKFKLIEFKDERLFFTTSNNSNVYKEFNLKYDDFIKINNATFPKETLQNIAQILGTSSVQQKYAYYLQIYKDFIDKKDVITIDVKEVENKLKNFYLVIDEINRGNISKIFGELITLIEESKRDDYEVTLPYSKKPFKVPSNLYIIATMNSTDKSIATIDIALRRRFTFLKMLPNENLVIDSEARELMQKCNIYIKGKLGEDYMLGHSYFMGKNVDLEFIKEYKIKPLLEEYFYAEDKSADDILKEIAK